MLQRVEAFFGRLFSLDSTNPPEPWRPECLTCEALKGTVQALKDQNAWLQSQVEHLEDLLAKATRLAPIGIVRTANEHAEPVAQTPQSWRDMKVKLENKYKRQPSAPLTPEDKTAEHWGNKISEMEGAAGLENGVEKND